MSVYHNDYVGLKLSKARQEELQQEAERVNQAHEQIKLRAVKRRLRLPRITISWN
jgi:hypothetical protein